VIISVLTVLGLAAVTVAAYRLQRRDRSTATRWVFVAFLLLTAESASLALLPDEASGAVAQVVRHITLAALPLFPYCLFRFTAVLTPSARWLDALATTATGLAAGATFFLRAEEAPGAPASQWPLLVLLLQWSFVSVATSWRLWRAGRREPAVTRSRIRTLSAATIALAIALLFAGALDRDGFLGIAVRLLPVISALLFLLALAPPAQLRAIWRRPEQERLSAAVADLISATSTREVIEQLLPHVARLLGGRGAALLRADGSTAVAYGVVPARVEDYDAAVEVTQLSVGRLVVLTSPYTPLFGRDEVEVARSLAHLAESAIERSTEHRIAETLQRSLLAYELPQVPGISLEARYVPGGAGAVGGDWYDVIPLPEGCVGLVIGDVMGHGIGAATLMDRLRSALRAYAIDGDPPRTVLTRLEALMERFAITELATVLYVIVRPDTAELQFASAGHLLPVLYQPGQPAVTVEGGLGPPLGLWREAPAEASATVPPDATVVLFTDGLVERRGEAITDGLERLRRALGDAPDETGALPDHLLSRLLTSGAGRDDAAMLLFRLDGGPHGEVREPREASTKLDPTPVSAKDARRFVTMTLRRWGWRGDLDVAQLLTSELVTNAVLHARTTVELFVAVSGNRLRVRVTDRGAGSPEVLDAPSTAESGRGLMLVDALASRWGVDRDQQCKAVWFEVTLGVRSGHTQAALDSR